MKEYKNQITAVIVILIIAIGAVSISDIYFDSSNSGILENGTLNNAISVDGEASVTYTPDQATFGISIDFLGTTSEEAKNGLDERLSSLNAILDNSNIDEDDRETSNYSVYPEYDYSGDRSEIIGYRASTSTEVTLNNLDESQDTLTELLDKASEIKDVSINGPYLDISNREELLEEAKEEAVKQAREKADALADAAGVKVNKVISITDSNDSYTAYPFYEYDIAAESADSSQALPEINLGSNKITANVSVTFSIK